MSIFSKIKNYFSPEVKEPEVLSIGNVFENANETQIVEALKQFVGKYDNYEIKRKNKDKYGEGLEDLDFVQGFGVTGLSSLNKFYNRYINKHFESNLLLIQEYRRIANAPEVAVVIEDAVNECIQEDQFGNVIKLNIINDEFNETVKEVLLFEFEELFYNRIKITEMIDILFRTYFIDGKLFYEKFIDTNRPKKGIMGIKKLPTETMDFEYDPLNGNITTYYQYLTYNKKAPANIDDAVRMGDIVIFEPAQIGYITYGLYGRTQRETFGYLEKARIPFNQLKLLETSVIIYRIIRSPERLVFKIDTGNMPRDKAMKYVEKVKNKFIKKQTYDPSTGELTHSPSIMSMLDNFFIPTCLSLNTKIDTLDGKTKTLNQIIDEYNNGIANEVYSVDQKTGKIIKGEVEWAGITRKNAELVRVHLDNDTYIDCTPDHKFVLRNGEEVMAKDLENSYDVMCRECDVKVIKVELLSYREDTGCLTIKDPGLNHNFALSVGIFVKNSSDGRGSDISSIGGNPSGFAEMADVHYFSRKLYRALKYPMSRIVNIEERRDLDNIYGRGELPRDEIAWAKFLERQQHKFCNSFLDLFLLHLDFKGYKKKYNIQKKDLHINMTTPSDYKTIIDNMALERKMNNYSSLSNNSEFSKYYLMKTYLQMDDEEIKKNAEGFEKDKEYGLQKEGGW